MYARLLMIVNTLKMVNGVAIDDHEKHRTKLIDQIRVIKAIGTVGDKVVGFDPKADCIYTLNELYIDRDGMVHVRRGCVALVHDGKFSEIVANITTILQHRCGYCGSTAPLITYEQMYGQGAVGHDCCPDCGGV